MLKGGMQQDMHPRFLFSVVLTIFTKNSRFAVEIYSIIV